MGYGIRPNTAIQVKQLECIQEFNKALPKSKQKQSLPLISSNNIGISQRIYKDLKKQKTELITKYHPIGQIDDYADSREDEGSKFSMMGKVRSLNIQSAK